jgi:acetyl-CoA acetyltransferase
MDLKDLRNKTAIVGVGYSQRQGKVADTTPMRLALEAAKDAIDDAGLKTSDIDGLLIQPVMGGHSYDIAAQMGIDLKFTANVDVMGASSGCITSQAALAAAFGLANNILCIYTSMEASGRATFMMGGPARSSGAFGLFGAAMEYGLAARRAMHEWGTGPETWAEIAINTRKWANLNPRATMFDKPMTKEDYLAEPWIAEPFRRADCCLVSDGARAFIVSTADRAKTLKQPPVYISGLGQHHHTADVVQTKYATGPTAAKESGAAAFRMAGIDLKDISACEIYDCFTYTVELTLQSYGFFKPGEGKDFFKNGRTAPGGALPVNTSGGLLSEVYYMGFTPLTEGVMQLRGNCGARQIKDPNYILCSGNGGILQTHSTVILGR